MGTDARKAASMKIALDARTIYRPARRGIGKTLLEQYRRLAATQPDWSVLAYHRGEDRPGRKITPHTAPPLPEPWATQRVVDMPGDRFEAWMRLRLPLAAWRDGADVLHCPANHCPSWQPLPTVVTVHDLIALDHPEDCGEAETRRVRQTLDNIRDRAAAVTCPSEYTRQRLLETCAVDPARVHVIPWAADERMYDVEAADLDRVADAYGLRRPYVLHFGAAAPRKNTRGVLEAWASIKHHARRDWTLLVVGLSGPMQHEMARTAARLNIENSVKLTGFAREEDIPALLSAAEVMVYPSFSEGFGLPILDAFAAGTPVITSPVTSLPEVAGDAAMFADPGDPVAIGGKLARLMRDPLHRVQLTEVGLKRAEQFTWQRAADLITDVLRQAVETPGQQQPRLAA